MLYLDLSTPRVLPLIKLSSGDDDRDPTDSRPEPSVWRGSSTRGKWSKYAAQCYSWCTGWNFLDNFQPSHCPISRPRPSQVRMCGGENIKPNWCWKKKLPAGAGQFLSTPRKERILNAGLGDSGWVLSRLGDVGFLFWTRDRSDLPTDDLPRHRPSVAKPEAKQWKWSLVTVGRRRNLD